MCCLTCGCLGFCDAVKAWPKNPSGVSLLLDRTRDSINASAQAGCQFCDLVAQAHTLLDVSSLDSQVDIRMYQIYPTEIALSGKGNSRVVEIYACAGMSAHRDVERC
jgi:hypothetical protein